MTLPTDRAETSSHATINDEAAAPITMSPAQPLVVGVDIGGTKVSVVVADGQGIRGKVSEPTVKQGTHSALASQTIRLIHASCLSAGVSPLDVTKVGVSACGPFVLHDGCVELAGPNICGGLSQQPGRLNDWLTAPLEAPLRAAFRDVRVENDGVAALEAERRWGALQGANHCAYVTWSTGIGVGLCVDGKVLRGKNGNAGHAGHTFVTTHTQAVCGCGLLGDLESLASGSAMGKRFAAQGYADAAAIFLAARSGDPLAESLVDEVCELMGRALFNLVATLDLERISLGGSVFIHNQAQILPRLRSFLDGKLPALTQGVELVPAGLGLAVGDCAALALVMA